MKKKLLVVGLIVALMVGGLVLVGCEGETICNTCGKNESKCGSWCGHSNNTCNC